MDLKGRNELRKHHSPCLSGSSQAPLIPIADSGINNINIITNNFNNGSERSTPVSVGSLPFGSPSNRTHHHTNNQSSSGTPLPPSSASATRSSIFFPPPEVPPRSTQHQQKQQLIGATNFRPGIKSSSSIETSSIRSPKSADINMNATSEHNREASFHNQHSRYSPASDLTRLNSPITAPAKTLSCFFPDPHSLSSHKNLHSALRSTDLIGLSPKIPPRMIASDDTNKLNNNRDHETNTQPSYEDSYHLYHEPVDPDDPSPIGPPELLIPQVVSPRLAPSTPNFSTDLTRARPPPLPPSSHSRTIMNKYSDNCSRKDRSSKDRQSDVSADIYFQFVSQKPNERANHRSRSYHGPKNSNTGSHKPNELSPQFFRTATKNLSTTSVTDIPKSPFAFTSSIVPMHIRDPSVKELIETESNYVHALDMILNRFASPLKKALRDEDYKLIFNHIEDFHRIHSSFQADLIEATRISTCFLKHREDFLKYGEFCATLSKAQTLLDELTHKSDSELSLLLERCQQEANRGRFKLRDLLSLPMQRILKYHLLLARIMETADKYSATSDDYQGLKRAHETMVDLGQFINEVKRDTEAIQIINDIQQSIIGLNMPPNTQLTDYGRLVTDGVVKIKVPHEPKSRATHDAKLALINDNKLKQKRYVFVFDKVMLLCKLSGVQSYQYKEALVLSEYEVDPNPGFNPNEGPTKHGAKEKWSYNFNLVRASDKNTYHFFTKTPELKSKWIEAIRKAIDNIRPQACRNSDTNHEFLMHTFEKASSCDHCKKLLLGLYYQGYRCRICHTSVHKKCLSAIRPCGLPELPPRPAKCNEPSSPSMRSNCSDDSHNTHFPPSNSSSTQGIDSIMKNEYTNLDSRTNATIIGASASFKECSAKSAHNIIPRPVSSLTNVSIQNSANSVAQFRLQTIRGSNSTPAINPQSSVQVRAKSDYSPDEGSDHLTIRNGDILVVSRSSIAQHDVEHSFAQLDINRNESELHGRNTRTGEEGKFPSTIVEIIEHSERFACEQADSLSPFNPTNGYVNFKLCDYPWFFDRMERDRAQSVLENTRDGTFLVRVSPKTRGGCVISLKFNSKVNHMRIRVSPDNRLYLSPNRYFKSVPELVSWYQTTSLVESFHLLDARLEFPLPKDRLGFS